MLQTRFVKCASIAGVTRKLLCTLQKLYHAKCNASAAFRLSSFLLKTLVSRVNLRICILIVRFCSMKDVDMRFGSGLPERTLDITSTIRGGEYLRFRAVELAVISEQFQ